MLLLEWRHADFETLVNAQSAMPAQPHQLPASPAQLITPEDRQVLSGDLANYNFGCEKKSIRP